MENKYSLTLKFANTIPNELFIAQEVWNQSQKAQHYYPTLMRYLTLYNLQIYYDHIVSYIEGPLSQRCHEDGFALSEWSVTDLATLISSLRFLEPENISLSKEFQAQWIDGNLFMKLTETICERIHVTRKQWLILQAIRNSLRGEWSAEPIPSRLIMTPVVTNQPVFMEELYGQLVVLGSKVS
jgi:hypothetical protein